MAIQYVGGRGAGRAGSTSSVNVAINSGLSGGIGSAAIAGDLVVVTVAVATQGRNPSCAVSGYTNKTQQYTTATTYDISVCTSYKIMPDPPDTTVTIPSTGNTADGQGYEIHVFRGVDPTQVEDVVATYLTGSGVNNRPDPQAIQPITPGAVIYCGGGGASSTGTTVFTAAYLSGFLSHNGVDTNDGTAGAGFLFWTSGSYNPAVWGGGSVNAANSWGATTLALRPYVPPPVTGTGEEDGQVRDEDAVGAELFSGTAEESDQPRDEDAAGMVAEGFFGTGTEEGQPRDEIATGALSFSGTGSEDEQARDEDAAGTQLFTGTGSEEGQPQDETAAGVWGYQGAGEEDGAACDELGAGALTFAATGSEDGQSRDELGAGGLLFAAVGSEDGQARDETATGALAFSGSGDEDEQSRDELASGILAFTGTGAQEGQPHDEEGIGFQGSLIFGSGTEERQPGTEDGIGFCSIVIIGFAEQMREPSNEDGAGYLIGPPLAGESRILAHVEADSRIMTAFLGESRITGSARAERQMREIHG